jgi:hypothetical protein
MAHGCGDYTVEGSFEGAPERLRELYEAWVALVGECGPFEQVPAARRTSRGSRQRAGSAARIAATARS